MSNQKRENSPFSLLASGGGNLNYPTCCPFVRFSHIGSIEDAARDGPCAHGKNLRPFPKYTVLYNYEKDVFGKGDRLHTVNLIITSIMAYLVASRGLEFASQLWLLSLIDR